MVRVRQERGEAFLEAGVEPPLVAGERIPGRHPVRPRGKLRSPREQADLMLARQRFVPPAVPARVEFAAIAVDPGLRRLMRGVASAGTEVHEERLVRRRRFEILHELDRVVDEIFGEVVAFLPALRRRDAMVIGEKRRRELVRLASEEAVVALEPATERPARPRGAQVPLLLRRQVPLADGVRGVALRGEHLREKAARLGDPAAVAGKARRQLDDAAHAGGVVVPARQDACPRGRAERRGVKVAVAETVRRQAVERGRLDVGAEAAELREANVVEDDDQDVRRAFAWPHWFGPPRRRFVSVTADHAGEVS